MVLTKNQIKQIQKIIKEHMQVLGLLFVGDAKKLNRVFHIHY